MLTIFNRAELLITYDLARFCQVRDSHHDGVRQPGAVWKRKYPARRPYGVPPVCPPGPTGLGANFFEAIGAIHVCFI